MRIIDCEQRSTEWHAVRRGLPTASDFEKIITPKTLKASAQQEPYIYKLIADTFNPEWPPQEGFQSADIMHGIECEPRALAWYEFENNVDVRIVGFCMSDCGRYGCSPDGLVGDDGGLEIKCPSLPVHVKYLMQGVLPDEYRCQVHGCLAVTGRKWWDFVSYSEVFPALSVRVYPDDFTAALTIEVEKFCDKYRVQRDEFEAAFMREISLT